MTNIADIRSIIQVRTSVLTQSGGGPLTGLNQILESDLDRLIDAAILDYSQDEPRVILVDKVPGDLTDVGGVKFFLLDQWSVDNSSPEDVEIEHPVDKSVKQRLRMGEDLEFVVVEKPTGGGGAREFWIKFLIPPSGTPGTWRLTYKADHLLIAADATLAGLSKRNVEMVALLSGVYTARFLQGKFGHTVDAQIDADVVDYRSKSTEWRDIANNLWEEYQDRLDRPSRIKRAGQEVGIIDLDVSLSRAHRFGRNYLVHRRRNR